MCRPGGPSVVGVEAGLSTVVQTPVVPTPPYRVLHYSTPDWSNVLLFFYFTSSAVSDKDDFIIGML